MILKKFMETQNFSIFPWKIRENPLNIYAPDGFILVESVRMLTSMVSNPVYCLAMATKSLMHSSGVVVPQVLSKNLRWETNIELSLRT